MDESLPVFPLPNTVFFPKTVLPLYVFEPRYQAMVRDARDGDGRIVVVLEAGRELRELGTVGRIRDLESLGGGRYNLRLEGLERVSIAELPAAGEPYRRVRVEYRPESIGAADAPALAEARLELLAAYGMLHGMARENRPLALGLDLPFEVVVNTVCASLPVEAALRQRLLAEDDLFERKSLAIEYISAVADAMSWLRAIEGGEGSPVN